MRIVVGLGNPGKAYAHTRHNIGMWAIERAAEFFNQGATHYRLTMHETIQNLLLLEAWKVRPEDEGEPHFQFAAR